MNEFGGSVIGLWIIFFLFLVAVTIGAFWWLMRTRNMKLRSRVPANDGLQQHEEFISQGNAERPPEMHAKH